MAQVTVLELPADWGDVASALARVEAHLARVAPSGLVLLPEASLTGYVSPRQDFDLRPFAEPLDGPTAQALAGLARSFRIFLAGPLVERDGARCFNALVGFAPDGARFLHYRKRHPWMPETWAAPGDLAPPRVEAAGLRCTAAICFDVHTLAEEAADALRWADLLLFPSAWVAGEAEVVDERRALLEGLARRFGVAVANANWGPGAVRVPGQGASCVLGTDGRSLAVAKAGAATAEVTPRAGRAA